MLVFLISVINNWGTTDVSEVFLMLILNTNIHELKVCLVTFRACFFLLELQFYMLLF